MNMLKSCTVLYAEDEGITRLNIMQQLNRYFKTVIVAEDGIEALELYKKYLPDVLILDINMPRMNGLDVVRNIRKNNTEIPIVMLTAYTEVTLLLDAVDLQLTKYLVKPLSQSKLRQTMEKLEELQQKNCKNHIILSENHYWDILNHTLYFNHKIVNLPYREHTLLQLLIKKHQQNVSLEEIMSIVWEDKFLEEISINIIKKLVSSLRKKLPEDCLNNVYNSGYTLNYHKGMDS